MNATVLHARIDPRRLGSARVAVHDELAQLLLSCAGSRHGYWMADRSTGRGARVTASTGTPIIAPPPGPPGPAPSGEPPPQAAATAAATVRNAKVANRRAPPDR